MLGLGCNAKSRHKLPMRHGGLRSMTRAGSSINGEASRSNSAGPLASFSTCRAMARAAWCGFKKAS
jgi:hypothetical protein